MKNLYKRSNIFTCYHETHSGFKNKISVFHILKEKKCYPQGCFYFRWHCKELSKRNKCHRGFTRVGRKCFGCRSFYEEKIHNYPELKVTESEYKNFLKELDVFEDWLSENENKELEILGTVRGVKPHFVQKIYPKGSHLSSRGYLLIFNGIYLGRQRIDDYVYGQISANYFQKLRLGKGDHIEAIARLTTREGRLLLTRFRRVDVLEKGEPPLWDEQRVLLARETATEFSFQPEDCVQCPFGALVDVQYMKDHHSHSHRKLLCLKGQQDYKDCYIKAEYCGLDREANDLPKDTCEPQQKIFIP